MIIEVSYQTKRDAADKQSKFKYTEFFESPTLPDKPAMIKQLSAMNKDFAEDTIAITRRNADAGRMRASGLCVTKLS
jgi:hypothetical protein